MGTIFGSYCGSDFGNQFFWPFLTKNAQKTLHQNFHKFDTFAQLSSATKFGTEFDTKIEIISIFWPFLIHFWSKTAAKPKINYDQISQIITSGAGVLAPTWLINTAITFWKKLTSRYKSVTVSPLSSGRLKIHFLKSDLKNPESLRVFPKIWLWNHFWSKS